LNTNEKDNAAPAGQPRRAKAPPKLGVDEPFEEAVRGRYSPAPGSETSPEILGTWIRYALETNERGSHLAQHLSDQPGKFGMLPRTDWRGCRVLDAGCAYGGTLRAFLSMGADVLGVDIDKELLDFAHLNMAKEDPNRFELLHCGIEDLSPSAVGQFDLITCDNVLEHVDDPTSSVARLADLLTPGGLLYVAVPNPFAPAQIQSDPHFGIFGITLLDRQNAEKYYRECGWEGSYTVGHYASVEEYFSWFAEAGLSSRYDSAMAFPCESLSASRAQITDLEDQVASLADGFAALQSDPSISKAILQALQTGFDSYHNSFTRDRAFVESSSAEKIAAEFMEWYMPLVWHFLAYPVPEGEPISRPSTIHSSRPQFTGSDT